MNGVFKVRRELRPRGLQGISDEQVEQHWSLYEGYVRSANALISRLASLSREREFGTEFSELKRRLGFECDGVLLHEHYFSVLRAGRKPLGDEAGLTKRLKRSFGGFDAWRREFAAMGSMRGMGWVILYFDPRDGHLSNHWVESHEHGHPAGWQPLLVMDVWEHAYLLDRGAGGRAAYVEAFLRNVDWPEVGRRLDAMVAERRLAAVR